MPCQQHLRLLRASLPSLRGGAAFPDRLGCGGDPPQFAGPLREDGPTLPPASDHTDPFTREGYAACKVAAELAALDSGLPFTVIRPSKVHGRWARNARTTSVVELMLRGEEIIELAHGDTIDHLTAAANAAALVETVAGHPGRRILNAADPDTPTAGDIFGAIAAELSWGGKIKRVASGSDRGHHQWQTPMTLDSAAARELGYVPVGSGISLIAEEVRWVLPQIASR